MSLISITNLTFGYEGSFDNIFENVSFQVDTDWKLGFTGRNGKGKTTFLRLLQGQLAYSGSIAASVDFDYFPFSVEDKSRQTLDVINSLVADFELWQLQKELSLLQVDEDVLYRPFLTLSNGEQTKVLLAALFLKKNNFLLIDEPTNHLDIPARKVVSNYLKSKKGFILVSHDRMFLDNCIDHILSINKANIEIQKGNFSSWQLNKERQDNFELAKNEKLKGEIQRLNVATKRTARWSKQVEKSKNGVLVSGIKPDKGHIGTKAAKMMKRAKSIETRQEEALLSKEKLLKNLDRADSLSLKMLVYPKNNLINVENLSMFYGSNTVLKDVSFSVNVGDRVALTGKNGSGKSSILKLLVGEQMVYSGICKLGSNLKISYIPQDTSFLSGNLKDFARNWQLDESLFKAILHKLDFEKLQFEKDIADFSEGQKKKVLLAKSLCEPSHLYVWDEPLNFIDVLSRMQIEELILNCKPTMIFVEHDSLFGKNVATKEVLL